MPLFFSIRVFAPLIFKMSSWNTSSAIIFELRLMVSVLKSTCKSWVRNMVFQFAACMKLTKVLQSIVIQHLQMSLHLLRTWFWNIYHALFVVFVVSMNGIVENLFFASFFHLSSSFLNYSKAEEIEAAEYENFCSWLRNCFFVYWHWNIFSDTVTRQPICYCTNDAPTCLNLFAIVIELFNPSCYEHGLVNFWKWHRNRASVKFELSNHEWWKPKCVSF